MAGFTKPKTSDLALERKVAVAKKQLGFSVKDEVTVEQVKERFSYIVKKHHPDSPEFSATPHDNSTLILSKATEAKNFLIKYLEEINV